MDLVEYKNLSFFLDDLAKKYSTKTALIYENETGEIQSYSYKELNDQINKYANYFTSLHVKKGDKVGIHLKNCPDFVMNWFALNKLGAILVPINAHFLKDEALYVVKKCKIKTIITDKNFSNIYHNIKNLSGVDIKKILIINDEKYKNDILIQSSIFKNNEDINCLDTAEILFTSGTTSRPKGVLITHYNLIFSSFYTSWQIGLRSEDIYLTYMPVWHIDFQCTALMPTLLMGATFVMLERYSARKFIKQIIFHKATITETIPKIIHTMLLQPKSDLDKKHCLREVLFYLNIPECVKEEFEERFNVNLLSSYGLSESIVGCIGDRVNDKRKWPSIGKVGFCYEVKILDELGNELPCNKKGEICIKGEMGKHIFNGYFNDDEHTKKAFKKGYFHTGDIGYYDEEGYFYFVDRRTNLIKISGENVSSVEIENMLLSHHKILEACVVSVKDKINDEVLKAFVVLKPKCILNEEEILRFCESHLAKFKIPKFIQICDFLPRTSTGKIKKNELRS